jgi:hypothetical protein
VGAELDLPSVRVSVHVEPDGGTPGPVRTVGAGLQAFDGFPVMLARGPQVVWVEADSARCGRGVTGVGEVPQGLELGLRFTADAPAQLGLRLLVEGPEGSAPCDFLAPGTTAEIRVSADGVHLGWFGPYPIQTGLGQAWIAGQVVVDGGVPRLLRSDELTVGAPW